MSNETIIKDTTSNPAPIGLLGFGMTTVLLNLHNAGFWGLGTDILAMGICYGGLAQIIAGIMEWKKNNTFGAVAFTSYGFFWLSLVIIVLFPQHGISAKAANGAMISYLVLWGLFTTVMFIGTLKKNVISRIVFGTLALLFFMLAIGDYTGNATWKMITGYVGIFCGLSAIYDASAQILNEVYGKTVLPLG